MPPPSQSMLLDQLETRIGGSKPAHTISDRTKVTMVVTSAIQRALALGSSRMAAAPISGTKVTRESRGRFTARLPKS